jgi:glycosyltransferase involved in cell wall biosynthesis
MPVTANATPRISVIIPAYKTAHLIAGCLDTVMAQTYQNFEAIVVNDGSPDTPELEKVLAPYMDRIVYIKQPNKRAAGARNTAIQHASGEFLAFLDSDDTWLPEHLASQMKLADADPALDLIYANALVVGNPEREWEFMDRCPSNGTATFAALIVERCQIPISTVVVRKTALLKAGGFDEKLPRCDDYDMWVRAAFHGAKIGYGRAVQAHLNAGRPDSLSEERVKMVEGYWNILEKFRRTLPLTDADRALVAKRAAQIKGNLLVEQGKNQLKAGEFAKARAAFSEANLNLKAPRLSLVLLGLRIAPDLTRSLAAYWNRTTSAAPQPKLGGART